LTIFGYYIIYFMNLYSIEKTPQQVLIDLAEKSRKLRKEKKMTQEELASRCTVSLGSIKRFERSGQVALASLLKIAFVLDRLNEFESLFLTSDKTEIEKLFKGNGR